MGAILAAYSLWIYRYLRIPMVLLSAVIIFSTMTTEWHYFADVLGGVVEICGVILLVRWLSRKRQLAQGSALGSEQTPGVGVLTDVSAG